jgi:sugar phosphate isomerase/epimerase
MTVSRRSLLALPAAGLAASGSPRAGCQTNAWRIHPEQFESFLAVLERIRKYGYLGFETGFRNVQGQFERTKEARAAIEKRGLRFLGCHIFLLEYDASTGLAPADLIDRVARGVKALGAERLILSGRSVGNDAAAIDRKAKELNRVAALCESLGIGLAYHNHDLEFRGGGEEMRRTLRAATHSNVRLMIDAGHAFAAGADVVAFFREFHARIDGLHLRDFRDRSQVPLGQGEFDLKPLAAAIRTVKWTGWIVNEEERLNDVKPGNEAVGPARKHVRKVFGV